MPADNIKRAIQKGTGELPGESCEEITYEGYAAGGVAVLIQVLTDNQQPHRRPSSGTPSRSSAGSMGSSGAVAWMFDRTRRHPGRRREDRRGRSDGQGARRRRLRRHAPVEKVFEITTAPAEMDAVREALAKAGVPILEAQVTYVPQSTVRVEGQDAQHRCCA